MSFIDFLLGRPSLRDLLNQSLAQQAITKTALEASVSALTDAVDRLTASVDAANDRITTLLTPLQTALAAAQQQLADLQVQDDADKAALESSLTDATNATSRILDDVS